MAEVTAIFKGSSGLNTVLHPLRAPYDPESGIMAMAAAVNVIVDDSGMVGIRQGYSKRAEGAWRDLFCDGGECVGVKDGCLCLIAEDASVAELRSGLNSRVSYAQVNDAIYYTSREGFGIVRNGLHEDWLALPYVGPDTNRSFSGPFPAEHIAFHLGRIWLAVDGFIAFSEPFAFSWFDLHRGTIAFPSRIRMLKPVPEGLFISDEQKTYFLAGRTPEELSLKTVAGYPAIERTAATELIEASELGLESAELCALWASTRGVCVGMSDGTMLNLTQDRLVYPETAPFGAGLLREHHYIHITGV